jgi:hypothetical protein
MNGTAKLSLMFLLYLLHRKGIFIINLWTFLLHFLLLIRSEQENLLFLFIHYNELSLPYINILLHVSVYLLLFHVDVQIGFVTLCIVQWTPYLSYYELIE